MNAYISNDLNMVKELDPMRHELALLQADWLEKGGTIEVLPGPSFQPPPKRHEPPPRKKVARHDKAPVAEPVYLDKITQREIEREERARQRVKDKAEQISHIRKLAETMTYAEATLYTGIPVRRLMRIAVEGGFKFRPAVVSGRSNLRPPAINDAEDAKNAERIKAFKELGLTRNQARERAGITHRCFVRLLEKFNIEYPRAFVRPAFRPKAPKQ